MMNKEKEQRIIEMALRMIPALQGRDDLEECGSDSEDFIEVSVWTLKEALLAAYELGKQNA